MLQAEAAVLKSPPIGTSLLAVGYVKQKQTAALWDQYPEAMTRIQTTITASGLAFILIYVIFSSKGFVYDEPHYLSNLQVIEQYGTGSNFIRKMKGPAGPLYAYVHYLVYPITRGQVIPTRLVNLVWPAVLHPWENPPSTKARCLAAVRHSNDLPMHGHGSN
jgi:hypothetical protein